MVTKTSLTTVENKIPDVSSFVKRTDFNTKVAEIENKVHNHNHDKYITTPEFNTLAADVFNTRLSQANLVTKTDFDAKLSSFNKKLTSNKTKHILVENELKMLKTFGFSYFIGKNHFEEDGTQNYLVFRPLNNYFKIITNTTYILLWQFKGLSDKTTKPPGTSDYKLNPQLSHFGTKTRVDFRETCLKQDKTTFNHGKIVNIYIVYELNKLYSKTTPTLVNCLYGAVSITKNVDIDKYKYSGYGIGFDRRWLYLLPIGRFGRNVIIFDMSSSVHVDNKEKEILIIGKGPTQELGEQSLTAEKICSFNFTDNGDKYCLSLLYNGANSYFLLMVKKLLNLKQKILRL